MPPPRANLTTGPIPRAVLSLAVPMMGSSTLQTLQSMVDMYFVGGLGHHAIAAVGMAGTALMVVIAVFSGVDVATAAMVARAIGGGDPRRASHVAGQSVLLTAALSTVAGVAGYWGSLWIMRALGGEAEVAALGAEYLRVSFAGLFFMCAMFVINGALHGSGDAVTPLMLGVLTTVINCVLTPAMIQGWGGLPAMGVAGSSLSTVISRAAALAVAVWLLFRGRLRLRLRLDGFVPNGHALWRLVSIGFPGSLQMSVRMFMNVAIMAIVAQFGSKIVAAYSVGMRLRMVGLMPLFCFGGAAATLVGQNLGARNPARAQRGAYTALLMALAVAGVMALALAVFAEPVMAFFTDEAAVIAAGRTMLRLTALGLVGAAAGIVLSRALNGAGDTMAPFLINLAILWGLQIPACIYLAGVRSLWQWPVPWAGCLDFLGATGPDGVWHVMTGASILHGLLTAVWFALGRWKRRNVD